MFNEQLDIEMNPMVIISDVLNLAIFIFGIALYSAWLYLLLALFLNEHISRAFTSQVLAFSSTSRLIAPRPASHQLIRLLIILHITNISEAKRPQPASESILEPSCEELRMCRHLFGLGEDPFPDHDDLGVMLPHSSLRDVLLVSVHISSYAYRAAKFLFGDTQRVSEAAVKTQFKKLIGGRSYIPITFEGGPNEAYVRRLGIRPLYHLEMYNVIQFPQLNGWRRRNGREGKFAWLIGSSK
ncbi:hypothetical protein F4802DRAFT_229253 [Xylaria palmicola]|nr:hypothetical protein F4802DRAFT_229253 [Xylaria palmicola]